MAKYVLLFLLMLDSSCDKKSPPIHQNRETVQSTPKLEQTEIKQESKGDKITPLDEIDLSKIGHTAPKGRVQDKEYNQLNVIEDLIGNGKDSIPFLIGKLDDKTKVEGRPVDFWGELTVGDIAHIILSDFFLDGTSQKSTIKGVGFYEFLDCKNPKETPAVNCYYEFIEKYGRRTIKAKWQKIWQQNKDAIYWDENERYFKLKEI